jgi:hypothetical protein
MSNEYVETWGLRLLKSDAEAYEKELAEADRGGNSRQRRDATKCIRQKYEALHVEPPRTVIDMFTGYGDLATDEERDRAIMLILEHIGMKITKTEATRHHNAEMKLSPID